MQRGITKLTVSARNYLSDLKATFTSTWDAALKEEGFGYYFKDSKGYYSQDVTNEIDSLLAYQKLMSFYESSEDDRINRERFLIDYIAPFYTKESLTEIILPRESFVERVIRNVAMLYKEEPARNLFVEADDGTNAAEAADEVYQKYIRQARIGVTAKKWHRLYTLTDAVLVRPIVRMRRGQKQLMYDILTPNEFRVLLNAEGDIDRIVYLSELFDDENGKRENILVVWTDEDHYYRDVDGREHTFPFNPDGKNPYPMMPFVLMARDEINPFSGGRFNLVESNLNVNFLEVLKNEDAAFAAMNVPFGINTTNPKEDYKYSPRVPIFVDNARADEATPDFKFVSGTPHSELLEMLSEKKEKRAAMREGISPVLLASDPTELSGKAMQISMTEVIEMREDDADRFESWERELAGLTAMVINQEEGMEKLPEPEALMEMWSIDFVDMRFDSDPIAEYEFDKTQVQDGIMSEVEFYRKYNTDQATEQEIMERLKINRNQRGRFEGLRGSAQTANAILGANNGA